MMRSIRFLSVIGFAMMVSAPALAGFEWVPPPEAAPAPAPAPQQQQQVPQQQQYNPYAQQQMVPMQPAYGQMAFNPNAYPQDTAAAPVYPPQQEGGYYAGAGNFPNPVPPMAPPAAASNNLTINPYPLVQAGYAPSMMGRGTVEGAMLSESRALHPLQLGGGMNTGGKAQPMQASVPLPPPQPINQQPMMMAPQVPGTSLSPMPGAPTTPLPGFAGQTPPGYAPYAPAPVMQAPLPPPVAINTPPMAPPPVINRAPADSAYPMGAPTSSLRAPDQPPAAAINASLPPPSGGYTDAVGFGKDLPLALALSQVIPGDYALFFETAIDAETNVSWQGGKPWNQVLQEMLAPLGLRAVIQPNLVMIRGA